MSRTKLEDGQKRTILTNIRMNEKEFETFNYVCDTLGMSKSELIARVVGFVGSLLNDSKNIDKNIKDNEKSL